MSVTPPGAPAGWIVAVRQPGTKVIPSHDDLFCAAFPDPVEAISAVERAQRTPGGLPETLRSLDVDQLSIWGIRPGEVVPVGVKRP